MSESTLATFSVPLDALDFVGDGLARPECVLCTAAGDVYTADARGGVARIRPDGGTERIGGAASREAADLLPNGIALQRDGSFLLADLAHGGVHRLARDGMWTPWLTEVEGEALPPTNFVGIDAQERVWITVSTRKAPRHLAYRQGVADGYIVLADERGARVVADGLGFTNECHLHPSGDWLYVNETFAKRLTRFRVAPDGSLSGRETVAEFGHGTFPDGLAFDEEGGVWIASVVSNRVIRVAPDGEQQLVLEDADAAYVEEVERAWENHTIGRAHLDTVHSERLQNISSVAFGGAGRRTVYLGCLLGERVATFRAPVAGAAPAHWGWG